MNQDAKIVETSELPSFSEILERDAREFESVEINFKDMSAVPVEQSDAPQLTHKVFKTLGKPIKTVEMVFGNKPYQVLVRDGVPLSVEVLYYQKVIALSKSQKDVPLEMLQEAKHADRDITNLWVAKLVADPEFKYNGRGTGPRIETTSDILIDALIQAVDAINSPSEDTIYQVEVRRRFDLSKVLAESVISDMKTDADPKNFVNLTEVELIEAEARLRARREAILPAVLPVCQDYPVKLLSERFIKTLYSAYRVIHRANELRDKT